MDERWSKLQSLVGEAAEVPRHERAAFLAAETDDEALRQEATELLDAVSVDDGFLEPLVGDSPIRIGCQIGAFRIVRPIARGGMGRVFEATQEAPARRVALKVMRDDVLTPASRRRFRAEVEALGALQHPSIAPIYQAGFHGGVPWFAMEYVDGGRTITCFCEEESLGQRARLDLMATVCDAIHHGHVKGVMHRDVKPDNLLVDRQGRVRVIDFGVARLVDAEKRMTTLHTETDGIVGTLSYMSPEQARGAASDARSDVYSLGVVLFQLMTGALPIPVDPTDVLTSIRRIAQDPPQRPASLTPALKGDVEAILLRALEKEPERRYTSAAALADDLRRHLLDEPIDARTPTSWDRARAFARRNRVLVSAAATVLVVAVAAAVISLLFAFESKEAERVAKAHEVSATGQRNRANQLVEQSIQRSMEALFGAVPKVHELPGGAEIGLDIVRNAIADLEALDQGSGGVPAVRLAIAKAHMKLSDILGNPVMHNIGDRDGAVKALDQAASIVRSLRGTQEHAREVTVLHARILRKRAEIRGAGKPEPQSLIDLDQASDVLANWLLEHPDDHHARANRGMTLERISWEWQRRDDMERSAELASLAIAEFERVVAAGNAVPRAKAMLSGALRQLAVPKAILGDEQAAATALDRAIDLLDEVANDPVEVTTTGLDQAWVHRAAIAAKQHDFDRADDLIDKARDHAIAQCRADPSNGRRRFTACIVLIEWVRIAEQRDGDQEDGTGPASARTRASQAADMLLALSPDKESKLVTVFAKQLRDYASGVRLAGSLMGAYEDRRR